MANLDTRDKRGSALGIDLPWLRVWNVPDGAIGAADRNVIGFKYSGIATGGAATATGNSFYRNLLGVGA